MNIYDVARESGVSPATVSRVLNGNTNVRKATRDKVLKVIEGAGYVPSMVARNLSIGQSQTIAFLVPDIENPFFSKVLHGITNRATDYDYNVFMFGTDENCQREHKILSSLNAQMIKGMIIIPVSEDDKETQGWLNAFEERGVPVVLLDRDIGGGFDGVFSEDAVGTCQAVECLIEAGHRDIAIITGPDTSRPGHERLRGFQMALEKHEIELNPNYVISGSFREEESYKAMKALMEMDGRPTAVFASNNMTSLGCLKYMKERGMILCEDVSLVGFDDIPELQYTNINLTVVARPFYEMGSEAMGLLQNRFQNSEYSTGWPVVVRRNIIKTWLIKRGSEQYKPFQEKRDII